MGKKYYKNENGLITVFTMLAMFFFLFVIIGIYSISSNKAQTQTESMKNAENKYYSDNATDIYNSKIASDSDTIPIYTKEQLFSIGTGALVEIEEKIYTFDDSKSYKLKNDIVIELDNVEMDNVKKYSVDKGDYNIYYTYNGYYYELSDSGDIIIKDKNFKLEHIAEINYVTDGLMVHYDAINNSGVGHDSNNTWKDLSGNGNDGTLNGCTWNDNFLSFDGIDDFVKIGKLNYDNVTVEAVVQFDKLGTTEQCIVSNFEAGGYGLTYMEKNLFQIFYSDKYYPIYGTKPDINKKYFLSGRYDNNVVFLRENDATYKLELTGNITAPQNDTIIAIGANPSGNTASGCNFNGKIYSVRIYNRALTDQEILQNYNIDKKRFSIE